MAKETIAGRHLAGVKRLWALKNAIKNVKRQRTERQIYLQMMGRIRVRLPGSTSNSYDSTTERQTAQLRTGEALKQAFLRRRNTNGQRRRKRRSTSLATREMQKNTTTRCHRPRYDEQTKRAAGSRENRKLLSTLRAESPCERATPRLGTPSARLKTGVRAKTRPRMFTATLSAPAARPAAGEQSAAHPAEGRRADSRRCDVEEPRAHRPTRGKPVAGARACGSGAPKRGRGVLQTHEAGRWPPGTGKPGVTAHQGGLFLG